MPRHYSLKAQESDKNNYAVVTERETEQETFEAIEAAIADEYIADVVKIQHSIDFEACNKGKTIEIQFTCDNNHYTTEISETWIY